VFRGRAYDPKFSPDGKQIAFWNGAPSVALAVPGSSGAWVVSIRGGEPRRVAAALNSARNPIWFRDGKSILVAGYNSTKALDAGGLDWWKASVNGQRLSRAGLYSELVRNGLQRPDRSKNARVRTPVPWVPWPACWANGSDEVLSAIRRQRERVVRGHLRDDRSGDGRVSPGDQGFGTRGDSGVRAGRNVGVCQCVTQARIVVATTRCRRSAR
jgi:hypothetical protein